MSQRSPVADPPRTLVEGRRLDQPTFHALYEATSPDIRAELVDGVVYLPGPIGHAYGHPHVSVVVWLGNYDENTPAVEALPRFTAILGWMSELEPDAQFRILTECGGRTQDEKDFLRDARSWWSGSPRRPVISTWGRS